jgi:cytochrome P450
MLSMVLHPEAQRQAQEEIDQVVGRDRLPTFQDYEGLPYVRALVKEVMRWRGVAPLGMSLCRYAHWKIKYLWPLPAAVPHRLCQDDWYELEGQKVFLPKDTICVVNVW